MATGYDPVAQIEQGMADGTFQTFSPRLQSSVYNAAAQSPDQAAQAQRVAQQTGVGVEIVSRNLPAMQQRAAVADLQQRNLELTNPLLAQQLEDPNFASVAHDDLDNLSEAGRIFSGVRTLATKAGNLFTATFPTWSAPGNNPIQAMQARAEATSEIPGQYQAGHAQFELGMLGIKAKRGQATPQDWQRIGQLQQQLKAAPQPQTVLGRTVGGVAQMAGSLVPMAPRVLAAGGTGALAGAGVGAVAGGVGAIPGAITGAEAGAESEFGAENYETMAGNTYLDLLDKGVDEHRAQVAAGVVGALNTALQMGALRVAGKPIAGAADSLAQRAINRAMGEEIAEQMTQPTAARTAANFAAHWAKSTAIGTGEMTGQTLVSALGEDWAKGEESPGEGLTPELGKKLASSAMQALLTMGTLNAMTGMVGYSADLSRARAAQDSAQFFTDLQQNAAESKVRGRNPDAYEDYIAKQAGVNGADTIYVDGGKMAEVLHQSSLDPEQLEKAIPGLGAQVTEAAATGGDVTIPTAQYAARLAGTDLGKAILPHMRLDPDAMSAAEAQEFAANQKELLGAAQQRAAEEMTGNEAFAQSAKNVEQNLFDQIRATKTMPDDVARVNAQLARDLVVTQAANLGVTPEEFYARYKPTIERAAGSDSASQPAGEPTVLNQAQTRGGFDPSRMAILLNDKADFSTFAHELGHYYLTTLGDLARNTPEGGPGRFKQDMGTLLNWFGVKDQDAWDALGLDGQRRYHEQFAYSFEKYLAEGKTPSLQLQGVFDRFKTFMTRVYATVRDNVNAVYRRQHGTDLPMMTGEVREVMDRMLATDEQIQHAHAVRNMEPLFRSKAAALEGGMSEAEWNEYREQVKASRDAATTELGAASLRNMQWLSRARSRVIKEMQAEHEGLRTETRAEVEKEMQGEDLRRAQRWLKTGEMETPEGEQIAAEKGYKLNAGDVKAMFAGKPGAPDLSKLRGMMDEEGMHPDVAAPMFGFDNGEQLVRNLADARPMKEEIDARTDQRMLERYGDMQTPDEVERRVNEALHNDARARMLATELKFVQRLKQPVRVLQAAAENVARGMVAQKRIGDISERDYAAGEARAERAAHEAMRKGDNAGVAKAVEDRLLQNALGKEAIAARSEVDAGLKFLSKFDRPSKVITKAIGADYMDRINELLAGYQLAPRAALGVGREDIGAWVDSEYAKTGVMPAIDDMTIARLGNMHWKDMTLDQLRGLRDAVKSLDYIGRRRTEVELEGKRLTVDELVHDVQERMAGVKHTAPVDIRADLAHSKGLDKIAARWMQAKGGLRSLDAALVKMEQFFQWMDAGKDAGLKEAGVEGPMSRIFRLASNAEGKERAMRANSGTALRELADKLHDAKIDLNDQLEVPELPRIDGKTTMYREELLAAALNMGNAGNREKLLEGYNWSDLRVQSAMNRLLSKPEMDFVQGVWDHIGTYGKEIVELQRRQTGVSPKMVAPAVVETVHGVYPGGYYPVVYDSFLDRNVEEKQARNADRLFENNYAKPSTNKGHTIERTGYKGPIWLSLNVIARHIDQVTHDLAWREAIGDMNKVLTDPRLRQEVEETYGREYAKQFRPWLQAMANDRVFDTTLDSGWEKMFRKVRSNTTMVGIGFRLSTMLTHGTTALSNSLGELGPKWFMKGAEQYVGIDRWKEARDFAYMRSPEMAHRMDEADRNLHEAMDDINRREQALASPSGALQMLDKARKFAYRGVMIADMASALPTWTGAYLKGMAKEANGGLNLSEEDAIEYANRAVRNAHGGGGVKDMSFVQRDKGALSLATMFYSYWNHVYNRERDLGKGLLGAAAHPIDRAGDFPRLLARSWFYFAVPQLMHALWSTRQQPGQQGDDLKAFAKRVGEETVMGVVAGVPIVRDMATAAVEGRDYKVTPLEEAGQSFVTAPRDAAHLVEGEPTSKHAAQNAANAAGYATGLPLSQPAATTKFLWDYTDGDADPQTLRDWYQGLLTGRMK